jgi:hypothetical protein
MHHHALRVRTAPPFAKAPPTGTGGAASTVKSECWLIIILSFQSSTYPIISMTASQPTKQQLVEGASGGESIAHPLLGLGLGGSQIPEAHRRIQSPRTSRTTFKDRQTDSTDPHAKAFDELVRSTNRTSIPNSNDEPYFLPISSQQILEYTYRTRGKARPNVQITIYKHACMHACMHTPNLPLIK